MAKSYRAFVEAVKDQMLDNFADMPFDIPGSLLVDMISDEQEFLEQYHQDGERTDLAVHHMTRMYLASVMADSFTQYMISRFMYLVDESDDFNQKVETAIKDLKDEIELQSQFTIDNIRDEIHQVLDYNELTDDETDDEHGGFNPENN